MYKAPGLHPDSPPLIHDGQVCARSVFYFPGALVESAPGSVLQFVSLVRGGGVLVLWLAGTGVCGSVFPCGAHEVVR